MHQMAIAQRLVDDKRTLEANGFTLYVPPNIAEVPDLFARTGRQKQSAMMSLANNDYTSATGDFLFLMRDGEPVAGARAKVVDLQGETFESHQRRTVQQWHDTDGDQIVSIAKPLNCLIQGKHIYAGELEFKQEFRGRRKITTAFVRVLITSALLKWPDANCIYCILPERHRQLAVEYGFNTTIRKAFSWREPIPGGRLHDWLVAVSSRDQLIHDLTVGYWGPAPRE